GEEVTDIRLDFKQKQIIFDELIEKASPMMSTFMQIVFENKRMDIMPAILENFNVRVDALSGIVKGKITSAVVLTKEQKETIEKQVANKFSIATIQLEEKVDETIVGGVIVEAQGKIIDGSVKTQLTKLRMLLSK
ncbi:MAG: ATP synthase F1 subunit delta, partial [Streptococcaceae bacterium]|nr:ATP synthase F1 subunit delta [Streptococcaceae bacterium]